MWKLYSARSTMGKYIVVRANALVFGVLVAILLLVGAATWHRFSAAQSARGWTQHTYEALATIQQLNLALRDAQSGQRGYLLTGNEDYLAPYNAALGRIAALPAELQRMTADNPAQQERLHALALPLRDELDELIATIQTRRNMGFEAAMRIVQADAGKGLMRQIEATLCGFLVPMPAAST